MGYFVGQSLLVVLAAFALGLGVGWLAWRRGGEGAESESVRRLRREHEAAMRWMRMEHFDSIQALRDDLARTRHEVEVLRVGPVVTGFPTAATTLSVIDTPQPVVVSTAAALDDVPEPRTTPNGASASSVVDDLQRIEGIGPKMAAALHEYGITTFTDLAATSYETLREATARHGLRFAPSMITWPDQARLLADGDDEGFARLTASLVAGRAPGARR